MPASEQVPRRSERSSLAFGSGGTPRRFRSSWRSSSAGKSERSSWPSSSGSKRKAPGTRHAPVLKTECCQRPFSLVLALLSSPPPLLTIREQRAPVPESRFRRFHFRRRRVLSRFRRVLHYATPRRSSLALGAMRASFRARPLVRAAPVAKSGYMSPRQFLSRSSPPLCARPLVLALGVPMLALCARPGVQL